MDITTLLQQVKDGTVSIEEAKDQLSLKTYENLDFARLDIDRKNRQDCAEVVYCEGKKDDYLIQIFKKLYSANKEVMGTRASLEQFLLIKDVLPNAEYNEEARIIKVFDPSVNKQLIGKVVVCTAGTSDLYVAKEAIETAEFLGAKVETLFDVGVSGIHRLLDNVDVFKDASCVIAIAGMEGALASVIGGLVRCPVIAVPTSVGYGANFQGLSALLTMINSCSNGIAVVNIDNGYGAGYIAAQINRQSYK